MKHKIIKKWVTAWNDKDIEGCAALLTPSVELRSTNILRFFPDSGGIIKGKKTTLKYFQLIFEKFPNIQLQKTELHEEGSSIILNAYSESINSYVQYFINSSGLIYLMKADITDQIR